jgi:hypothetical protein
MKNLQSMLKVKQEHNYMERIGVHFCFGTPRPEPLKFDVPVFWGGSWVTQIDLLANSEPKRKPASFADLFAAAVAAVPDITKKETSGANALIN